MRTWNLLAGIAALFLLAGTAKAVTFPLYLQDDFTLTFGAPANPGAAGGQLWATGHVLTPGNFWAADFLLTGGNPNAAYLVGNEYWTDYDVSITMGESDNVGGFVSTFWSGTGEVTTRVKDGGGLFPPESLRYSAAGYWHPADQPEFYQSVGSGAVMGAGSGDWAGVEELYIPWFGTYNWRYDEALTWQKGNMQGMLMDVPEPGSLLLLVAGGLVALAIGRRRKK